MRCVFPVPEWLGRRIKDDVGGTGSPVLYEFKIAPVEYCNLSCRHCYLPYRSRDSCDTDTGLWIRLLDQAKDLGAVTLSITGGEPLLNKDIYKILDHGRKNYFYVELLTNGTLIDKSVAEKLAGLHISSVGLSLYAASANLHDVITGVVGSWDKTIISASLLREAGVTFNISCSLMRDNFDEIEGVESLAREFDCPVYFSPMLLPHLNGDLDPLKFMITDDQARQRTLEQADKPEVVANWKKWVSEEQSVGCGAGRASCYVNSNGSVMACPAIPISAGNAFETPLSDIWRDGEIFLSLREAFNEKKTACHKCSLLKFCMPCYALSFFENGSFWNCSSQCQRMAENWSAVFKGKI